MFLRYLAIPVGISLAFAPTRNLSWNLHHTSNETHTKYARLVGDSDRGERSKTEKNGCQENICRGIIALADATSGTISRRKALVVTGAAAAATTAVSSSEASMIPATTTSEVNINNRYGMFGDSQFKPNKSSSMIANVENDQEKLLRSSSVYRVQTKSSILSNTKRQSRKMLSGPSVNKVAAGRLVEDLKSKRAILLGEHHPDGRDHRLQAALIRSLYDAIHNDNSSSFPATPKIVVGLEAVQRKFQPVLDLYCAGAIGDDELVQATEWESRWYWSFEAYKPIFHACRELGIGLLALDISTEDRLLVEQGGLEALDRKILEEYVPDQEIFSSFGSTLAYKSFVSYTLKPPYMLQQRTKRQQIKKNIEYSNFVARQMLRDEGMASAAYGWLSKNPSGILVGCIGINHATFGCGVQGRLEQKVTKDNAAGRMISGTRNQETVASVLINPEPLNTGTELKLCRGEGRTPIYDDDEEDDSTFASKIFVPNIRNQVCIENSIEVQNYALQIEFVSLNNSLRERRAAIEDATRNCQIKHGETALGLCDYMLFSPKQSSI